MHWRVPTFSLLLLCACSGSETNGGDTDSPNRGVDQDADGFYDLDCDDTDPAIYPGAVEVCDGVDQDCDDLVDEDATDAIEWYEDRDGDGYGVDSTVQWSCTVPDGGTTNAGDCNDDAGDIHPAATERGGNYVDEDCDGLAEGAEVKPVFAETDCRLSEYVQPTIDTVQLRIISSYEPDNPFEPVHIHLEPQAPVYLVLASYEPVDWVITEEEPGTLQHVVESSYASSSLSLPDGVSHEFKRLVEGSSYDWDDRDTRRFVRSAEMHSGLTLASFHGCYGMEDLTLSPAETFPDYPEYPECNGTTGSPGPSAEPDLSIFEALPGCRQALEGDTVCVGLSSDGVELVGLESGSVCQASPIGLPEVHSSIAWQDEFLYGCDYSHNQLQRLNLRTGFIEKSYVYCDSVTDWNGVLIVNPDFSEGVPSATPVYESWESAQCLGPEQMLSGVTRGPNAATRGDRFYGAWHSTDAVEVYSLPSMEQIDQIDLEGFDAWILGLSVPDEETLVFSTHDGIRLHNLSDGSFIRAFSTPHNLHGLVCYSR